MGDHAKARVDVVKGLFDEGDDPVYYATLGIIVIFAACLLGFVLWAIGSLVWGIPIRSEIYWPGVFTSVKWFVTGLAVAVAFCVSFWKFGQILMFLAKRYDNDH